MKTRNNYLLTILLLFVLVALSACGGGEKTNDVITDKSEITTALEPVRQALPRIYDVSSGTLTGEYEGALLAGTNVKEQLDFKKKADGTYSYTYKTTDKTGSENKYIEDDTKLIPLAYPTVKILESSLSSAGKLTIKDQEDGTEYRLDLNIEPTGGGTTKDAYLIFFMDKSDIVTKFTLHFVNSQGKETLVNSEKILLNDYKL